MHEHVRHLLASTLIMHTEHSEDMPSVHIQDLLVCAPSQNEMEGNRYNFSS